MVQNRARLLLVTLWVGSLWTIGYIVAPLLFSSIDDKALAGQIAGRLFGVSAWVSIVCGSLLFMLVMMAKGAFDPRQHRHLLMIIAAMILCSLVNHFGVQPAMTALRVAVGELSQVDVEARFNQLHSVSSAIYMLQSVLGVVLVFKIFHAK